MPKYRRKPIVIEAVQWTGENWKEIYEFARDANGLPLVTAPEPNDDICVVTREDGASNKWHVPHVASKGDWIVKGVRGEVYPCKPDIFEETYEIA